MTEFKPGDYVSGPHWRGEMASGYLLPKGQIHEGARERSIAPRIDGYDFSGTNNCSFNYIHEETMRHADAPNTAPVSLPGILSVRASILQEAETLITGDRNKTYGSPTENFANTAALWNVQIGHKLKEPITATEVALMMAQLKLARMIAQPKRDNFVDAVGYIACGAECEDFDE